MRLGVAALALIAVLAPVPAFADWMTFVGRNIATGERTSFGAKAELVDQRPMLAIVCYRDGLGATFDTGLEEAWDVAELDAMAPLLLIGADGGAPSAFPATSEIYEDRESRQVRARLAAADAAALAQLIVAATSSIDVVYRLNGTDLTTIRYAAGAAASPIRSVLAECEGRGAPAGGKSKAH